MSDSLSRAEPPHVPAAGEAGSADDGESSQLGVVLDRGIAGGIRELLTVGARAAELGYHSVWTTGRTYDPFQLCSAWALASEHGDQKVQLGISVVPVTSWPSAFALANAAAATAGLAQGRFVLGLGLGHPSGPPDHYQEADRRPLQLAREYLESVRLVLSGRPVTYEGAFVSLRDTHLGWQPPRVPVYLGALGPRMLELAGTSADGVIFNWSSAAMVAESIDAVRLAAGRAGREPSELTMVTQVRVCLDEDVDSARRALARQLVTMVIRDPLEDARRGYRAHLARMGYGPIFDELVARRTRGSSYEHLAEAVPAQVIDTLAYAGPAAGAPAAVRRLADGCALALIRNVNSRPGVEMVRSTLEACRPGQ